MTSSQASPDHARTGVAAPPHRPGLPGPIAPRARCAPRTILAGFGVLAALTAAPATAASGPLVGAPSSAVAANVGQDLGLGTGGAISGPGDALPGVTSPPVETRVETAPETTVPAIDTRVAIPGEWSPELLPPQAPAPTTDPGPHPPVASVEVKPVPAETPAPRSPSEPGPGTVDFDSDGDLTIDVTCGGMRCAFVSGTVDLGSGLTLDLPVQSSGDRDATPGSDAGSSMKLNLRTWAHEYREIRDELGRGGCVVVRYRVRMETPAGDEIRAYAQPICGSKVTLSARRPLVTEKNATRRIKARAVCSKACDITPRFLLVKQGNTVLARATKVRVASEDATRKVHTTTWQLSRAQEADILRSAHAGSGKIRYIVSAHATSAGVATVGTASFRTRSNR